LVDLRSSKGRALLAYLLLAQARPMTRANLTNLLWQDYTATSARTNLRQTLASLRQALSPLELLQSNYQTVQIQLDPTVLWCDVLAFDELLDACQHHSHEAITTCPACQARLRQAVALYQGGFLEHFPPIDSAPFTTWLRTQQSYYAERFAQLLALLPNNSTMISPPPVKVVDENGAPTTRQTIPHNLLAQLTSFVGREANLAELKKWFSGDAAPRLLTLTGTGGVGKTRLALQVATQVLPMFRDGVWLVDLAPLTDPALLPTTVATVLGVRTEVDQPLLTTLVDWLQGRQLLLLLDNCEHLVADCAAFVDTLLRASDTLRILTTSREALGITGERRYEVPPLAFPATSAIPLSSAQLLQYEAVRLFAERATCVQPRFRITAANAQAVAQLCQRLDGIPLALELAAARGKALPIATLAARLDDRFRLLVNGNRATLPRHQTLRAMIDWSYELLSAAERILLRRLAIFAGGWTLEAAEAVCADPATATGDSSVGDSSVGDSGVGGSGVGSQLATVDVLDCLTQLVEKSLVVLDEQDNRARYHLLETIRQYADEKLRSAQEAEALGARHLQFFLALAAMGETALLDGRQRAHWLRNLTAEHDNLQAALTWSYDRDPAVASRLAGLLRWYWNFTDLAIIAESWYQRVLALYKPTPVTPARALALLGLGLITADLHSPQAARPFLEESLAGWQAVNDPERLRESFMMLIYTLLYSGEAATVCTLCAQQEAFLRATLTPFTLVHIFIFWGRALVVAHCDFAAAQSLSEQAQRIGQQVQDPLILSKIGQALGHIAAQQGDYATAKRHYLEVLAWRRQAGIQWVIGIALKDAADTLSLGGDLAGAYPLYWEALALQRKNGLQHQVAYLLARLGDVATQQGDADSAAAYLLESVALYQTRGIEVGAVHLVIRAAEHYVQQGQPVPAVQLLACTAKVHGPFLLNDILAERTLAATRTQLTTAAFAAAWANGEAMTLDAALALARQVI